MDQATEKLIDRICRELAKFCNKRKFAYYDFADLYQESWVIALEALDAYNPKLGPLENFLRTVIRNRLITKFIQISKLTKNSCKTCNRLLKRVPFDTEAFDKHKNGCRKYNNFILDMTVRSNLLSTSSYASDRPGDSILVDKIAGTELAKKIVVLLPNKFQKDFFAFINHERLSPKKMEKLTKVITDLLNNESIREYREKNGLGDFVETII